AWRCDFRKSPSPRNEKCCSGCAAKRSGAFRTDVGARGAPNGRESVSYNQVCCGGGSSQQRDPFRSAAAVADRGSRQGIGEANGGSNARSAVDSADSGNGKVSFSSCTRRRRG